MEATRGGRAKAKKAEAKDMKFRLLPPSPPKIDPSKNLDAASSDFNQWLHAMKMVARLPGGMPPEFRRKLWLALADRYLQSKKVDWNKEQEKCFSEQWREDDEELGIQIVKDLHRTGSSICSGPAGSLNQAKLKRVLLGYARWNPEVGYCQGFNMLGALILQVMDKSEEESMKVMIYLVEGVLPPGYFSGSLGGLQADMAVFRELMTSKLPKLAKHLQRLQGPLGEGSFEPPLTNVFTMQWFLTLFCTCLPINCVLRIWDLIMIEGSDVLLRTALAIWSLLEGKILTAKTADDYYCRMGTLSGELLNGHLIDSNGLIEKIVELGPIAELQKLREKHLYNIAPWQDKKGLRIFYSDDDADSDEDSRLAVATVWGLRLNRRGSSSSTAPSVSNKPTSDNKDRIALDISLLKKQYDRLRERQRQAHIILTAAVAKQGPGGVVNPSPQLQMNQLLMGRSAIVTNKGRRIGPPPGAIPPARKMPATTSKPLKQTLAKPTKRGETLHWHDTEAAIRRKSSITLRESSSAVTSSSGSESSKSYTDLPAASSSTRSKVSEKSGSGAPARVRKKSESSSYSEDSDANSSTSTSLCDDDDADIGLSSLEASPLRKFDTLSKSKYTASTLDEDDHQNEVPAIVLINLEEDVEANDSLNVPGSATEADVVDEDSSAECDRSEGNMRLIDTTDDVTETEKLDKISPIIVASTCTSSSLPYVSPIDKNLRYLHVDTSKSTSEITSTSQLSPIADISTYISSSTISPLKTPSIGFNLTDLLASRNDDAVFHDTDDSYDASEEGVTNEYFERVNLVERPKNLELFYSLNERCDFLHDFKARSPEPESTKPEPGVSPIKNTEDHKNDEDGDEHSEVIGNYHEPTSLEPTSEVTIASTTDHCKIQSSDDTSPKSPSSFSVSKLAKRNPLHHHIDREKSFSFDDATTVERQEPRPTSCPEARADIVDDKCRSDRVLKIIEENSMILHRILKKHALSPNAESYDNSKEVDAMDDGVTENEDSKAVDTATSEDCESKTDVECNMKSPSRLDNLLSPISRISPLPSTEEVESAEFLDEQDTGVPNISLDSTTSPKKQDRERCSSRSRSRTETPLRYDDNIADRLASIKNTIKSIDSLCDDRSSYKNAKCQRYIDSLFEQKPVTTAAPLIQISEPDYNFNKDFTSGTDLSSYSPRNRYSRDLRRDISPRRRMDEDREEYESRARRDNLPIYSPTRKDNADRSPSVDRTLGNNNKSPLRWNEPTTVRIKNDDDDDILSTINSYVPNRIEIRHTTVTATMYDRYLYQKRERDARTDRSPSSPTIITKAYLDSLKPNAPPYTGNRYARSAENSPSRNKVSSPTSYATCTSPRLLSATSPSDNRKNYQIRSCDNILVQLGSSTTTTTTAQQPASSLTSPSKSYLNSLITVEPYRGPLDKTDFKS